MGEDFRKLKEFTPLAEAFFEWLEDYVLGGSPSVAGFTLPPASVLAWMAPWNHRKNPWRDSLSPVGGLFPRPITKLRRCLMPIAARDTVRLELTFEDGVKPSAQSRPSRLLQRV